MSLENFIAKKTVSIVRKEDQKVAQSEIISILDDLSLFQEEGFEVIM